MQTERIGSTIALLILYPRGKTESRVLVHLVCKKHREPSLPFKVRIFALNWYDLEKF